MSETAAGASPGVVVTGASRGIGLAIAQRCAAEGMRVAAVARSFPGRGAGHFANGGPITPLVCDLADPAQRRDLAARCAGILGDIHGWVNNAGMAKYGALASVTAEDVAEQFELNVNATLALSVQAMPYLAATRGALVNMASTLGVRTAKERGVYAATKAAVISLTQTLALEHGHEGVRINVVAPGVIDTDMIHGGVGARASEDNLAALRKLHPMGRLGTADEVADAVLYLLRAPWTTGAVLAVDGGLLSS